MELKVVTTDGKQGVLASSVLGANAFRPVEVRFSDGESARYYLRELRICAEPSAKLSSTQLQPS